MNRQIENLHLDDGLSSQRPSRRKSQMVLILLGCGILQLPIWGFAMTFGIFENAYSQQAIIKGSQTATGTIGTTMNGVMYLSMPLLSTTLGSSRWAGWRRRAAIGGACLSAVSFLVSSWSTEVWHLILLQGVFAAFGNAMMYTPTTLWLDEYFRDGNRATAYGIQFSIKNIVGTSCPFLMYALLQVQGVRMALRIWSGIFVVTATAGLCVVPSLPPRDPRRPQRVPWSFLKHRTFYLYAFANTVFSSGYGLPQTYLSIYASQLLHLPAAESSATIAIFNAPGILSCTGFGLLSDKFNVSATNNTLISALGSALSVFLLWGLKSHTISGLLIAFCVGYGFFASGYSSTWGGWILEIEREAAERNEAINSGVLYGLLNGARGVGYVIGGITGVELLKVGPIQRSQQWAWGTRYGALILFTGISSVMGGWTVAWKFFSCKKRNGRF